MLAVAAVTVVCARLVTVNHTTIGFLYLITVLIVAAEWGLIEAIVASLTATLCFNFFFLPHSTWLELSGEVAPEEIHHHDVVHFALEGLRGELSRAGREEVLQRVRQHLQRIRGRRGDTERTRGR